MDKEVLLEQQRSKYRNKSGWMCLQERRESSYSYKRYFFKLDYPSLSYALAEDEEPLGVITLEGKSKLTMPDNTIPTMFELKVNDGAEKTMFRADSPHDAHEWLKSLANCIGTTVLYTKSHSPKSALTRVVEEETGRKLRSWSTGVREKTVDVLAGGGRSISMEFNRDKIMQQIAEVDRDTTPYESECTLLPQLVEIGIFSEKFEYDMVDSTHIAVKAGTLKDILNFAWLHCEKPNRENLDARALLMCMEDYTTPQELLGMFGQCVADIRGNTKLLSLLGGMSGLQQRVLNFARQWIDGPLLAASVDDGTPVRKALFEFCSQLLGKQTTKQSLSEKLILWRRRYTNLEQPDVAGRDHLDSLDALDPEQLAVQLTLFQADLFKKVLRREFLRLRWQKKPEESPNLSALSVHFNLVSRWASATVLRAATPKERGSAVKRIVRIAKKCFELRNYDGCVQLVSALNDISIQRLKTLRDHVPQRHLDRFMKLDNTFKALSNYKPYRALPHDAPCIPFIAVTLRDLTFAMDGNPKWYNNEEGVVNFQKLRIYCKAIYDSGVESQEMFNFTALGLRRNSGAQQLLETMVAPTSEELYEMSLKIEPLRSNSKSSVVKVEEPRDFRDDLIDQLRVDVKKLQDTLADSTNMGYNPENDDVRAQAIIARKAIAAMVFGHEQQMKMLENEWQERVNALEQRVEELERENADLRARSGTFAETTDEEESTSPQRSDV